MLRSLSSTLKYKNIINLSSYQSISNKIYYANHVRNSSFSTVTEDDIEYFKKVLEKPNRILTKKSDLESYNQDWMNRYKGQSKVALFPTTTEQVSKILKYCNERKLAICPQGGNTGLVGGSIPIFDEVILSTSKLNKIQGLDEYSGVVQCESGVILETLNDYLSEHGFIVPLDLGAKGSCQIGGNISTNAGGIRLVRYGSLHGSVLGLEVVLADGTILSDGLQGLRKDNTGYDLKQLFIGSEGTLGIVTKISLLAAIKPKATNLCLLGCQSFDQCLSLMRRAKDSFGEILSAVEFMDNLSLKQVLDNVHGATYPLENKYPFYTVIETSGSNETHDGEKLSVFLEKIYEEYPDLDGVIAENEAQQDQIWTLRETIAEGLVKGGSCYKYDISLNQKDMYKLVHELEDHLTEFKDVQVMGYGHIGDGNLHLNIKCDSFRDELQQAIEPYVFQRTKHYNGSISAEHGLGQSKGKYLHYSKSDGSINLMKNIKKLFDPNNILNPYKVLP